MSDTQKWVVTLNGLKIPHRVCNIIIYSIRLPRRVRTVVTVIFITRIPGYRTMRNKSSWKVSRCGAREECYTSELDGKENNRKRVLLGVNETRKILLVLTPLKKEDGISLGMSWDTIERASVYFIRRMDRQINGKRDRGRPRTSYFKKTGSDAGLTIN